jgi:hypothetical protein
MNKAKIAPVVIILLVAALYGGFKGYVYYQVSSELDRMISMVRPFADISYGGISSTLDGSIAIEGIRVQPQGAPEELAIDVVSVKGDGALFLLKAVSGMKQGDPPEKLAIRVLGFSMPLTGDLAFSYSGMFKGVGEQGEGSVRPLKDCALGSWAYPEELRTLGLEAMVVDTDMSYEYRKSDGYLHVTMESSVQDIETTTINVELSGMPQAGAMMMGAMPTVKDFTIGYELDPAFAARSLERCADVRGLPMPVFIDSLFEGENPPVAQILGIVPGPGIRDALKKYLMKPGEISISVRPPADLDLSSLMLYKPQDVALLLNTKLLVNGERVDDITFEVAAAVVNEMEEGGFLSKLPGMEEAAAKAAKKKESQKKAKPKIQLRYQSTPVNALAKYVGRDVRIHTNTTDVVREGELTSVKGEEVTVLQRVHRGKLSVHVPLADIKSAEVLRIVK